MKLRMPVVACAVLLLALTVFAIAPYVLAQSNQVTATVNLNYLNIQVTYPPEVSPGDTVTAHIQATAKSSFYLASLVAQVFYADGNNIKQLATKTIAGETSMTSGKSVTGDIQLTVPQDAPRTSLVAAFTERVQVANYDHAYYYYYYPGYGYYYNYSYPYYYYCYGYSCSYPYPYSSVYYTYPSYAQTITDVGITSMPYIKANTPEAMSLQTQNQQLQQQLSQSQADNQKLQADNQKLQQDLQNAQQTIDQQNSQANSMNQQLSSSKNLTYGLGALAAIFAVLAAYFRGQRGKVQVPPQQQQYGQYSGPGEPAQSTVKKEPQA